MKISVASPGGLITYEASLQETKASNESTSTSGTDSGAKDVSNATSTSFQKALNTATVADQVSSVTAYKDIFIEASEKYGVSYDLLTAIAQQESGFNPDAVSDTGAMGIMQLMPSTAEEMGVTNPYDAYENIMGGAKYIAEQLEKYNGSLDKALAAYNAGPSTVDDYGGVPPYGETTSYVKNVKAIMKRGADVPYKNYVSASASRESVEADLKSLLSELPDSDEYTALKSMLADINYI